MLKYREKQNLRKYIELNCNMTITKSAVTLKKRQKLDLCLNSF